MSDWSKITKEAEAAKRMMVMDRLSGEEQFGVLLGQYPGDGMVFFKRGEAYEAIGEFDLAAADFRRAEVLFPMPGWKARAREALNRVDRAYRAL